MTVQLPRLWKSRFGEIAARLRYAEDEVPEFTKGASRALAGSAPDAFDLGYLVTMRALEEAAEDE